MQTVLAGMATSVLAAGLVTANSDVARRPSAPAQPQVALAATTIPIIDFDWILGPLRVARKLTIGSGVSPNGLVSLDGAADTWWDASVGPTGEVKSSFTLPVTLAQTAPTADLGFEPEWKSSVVFSPLGAAGPTIDFAPDLTSKFHLIEYRGGVEGYGFGVTGTLLQAGLQGGATSPVTMFGGSVTLGEYKTQLSVLPSGGLKASFGFAPYFGGGGGSIQLGTTKIGTTLPSGQFKAETKLCLGSAAASCGGVIAGVSISAMLGGALLAINSKDVLSIDFPDSLTVELKTGSLAVTGNIGGTVTIGTTKLGGVIPINIKISPPAAASASSTAPTAETAAAQKSVKSASASSNATSRKAVAGKGTASTKSPKAGTKRGAKTGRSGRD
ncbi:hypothetical protein BST42_26560 [Mycolicibacterium rhodesiae]|uniref:MspA protein n=2 Tax=Mycolicibacterium rhodesiae TaxID=36814 RepID=A0A1X0IJQ2_MYCRH|nr:hypothetical protein BST42_26560 [Mycolicibacterium rhodesiae]